MIYQGGSWPEKYHDQIFMNNIHGARLNQDKLMRKGSGYVGDRAPDFLFANDRSSQILYFRYGPDGQVYAIDWYDIQQCHTTRVDDHDRGNGRVYRIAFNNALPEKVDVASWNNDKLVEALTHKNQWYVRTARRILQERSVAPEFSKVAETIRSKMKNTKDSTEQLNYLWTLASCDRLTQEDFSWAISGQDAYVRGWGVQLGVEHLFAKNAASVLDSMTKLAQSKSLTQVDRLYLSAATLKLPVSSAGSLLKLLVTSSEDNGDHNLPLMYWYSLSRIARENPQSAGEIAKSSQIDILPGYLVRQLSSSDELANMSVAMNVISHYAQQPAAEDLLQELVQGLATRKSPAMPKDWSNVRSALMKNKSPVVNRLTLSVAAKFRDQDAIKQLVNTVSDSNSKAEDRVYAINTLRDIRDERVTDLAAQLLADPAMRSTAINVLADDLNEQRANDLLSAMKGWSMEDRRLAVYALTRRASTANVLWQAMQNRTIGVHEVSADMIEQLGQVKDFSAFAELKEKWSAARQSVGQAEKQIAQLKSIVESRGDQTDLGNGKVLFAKTCGQCHQLFGEGANIGPELTGSNRRDLDYLFSNIVTPSAVMAKDYQPWIVQTSDGRVLTGLLRQKTDASIVLQTTTELVTLYTDEIDGMKQSEQSMMPENLLATLTQEQIADLVAYLRSK